MREGKKEGVLFVFSGPSGVGKGTLKAMLFDEFAGQVAYSVSATTREPERITFSFPGRNLKGVWRIMTSWNMRSLPEMSMVRRVRM